MTIIEDVGALETNKNHIHRPTIQDIDYIGKQEEQQVEQPSKPIEIPDAIQTTSNKPPYIKNQIDKRYQSISLPSCFKFYDFKSLMIRKFEIRDLSKMNKVVQTGSYQLFKQVIQDCIDVDIDLLTPSDFKYICYWLRTNSYTKTPIRVEWKSRYGNQNVSEVTKDTITELRMDASDETLKQWMDKGFTAPIMKFADVFDTDKLDLQDDFIYSHAQYFKGDTWDEKIATMEKYTNENGLESIGDVETWDKIIEHGVEEKLTVYDLKFDANEWKTKLEENISKAKTLLKNLDNESDDFAMVTLGLSELQDEYKQLCEKLDKGEEVRPEPEEIFCSLQSTDFLYPAVSHLNS